MRLRNKEIGPPTLKQPPKTSVTEVITSEQPPLATSVAATLTLEQRPLTTSPNQAPTIEQPPLVTVAETSTLKVPPVTQSPPPSTNNKLVPFANDPVRGPPLAVPPEEVEALNGPNFLSTSLIDYLIRLAAPKDLPDDVLLGSSNAMSYFDLQNKKKIHPTTSEDANSVMILRRKYQFYSLRRYRFISVNCTRGHFFVVSVIFDMTKSKVFDEVLVYDSIRKSGRKSESVPKHSEAAKFLMMLQLFLHQFCAFATKSNDILVSKPDFILKQARFVKSPEQKNSHDCGIFAIATMLHLIDGSKSMEAAFTQQHIGELRQAIYKQFKSGTTELHWDFYCTFLPSLKRRSAVAAINSGLSSDDEMVPFAESDDSDRSYIPETESVNPPPPLMTIDKDMTNPDEKDATEILDTTFSETFIQRTKAYKNLLELNTDIDQYEEISGYRLIIKRSDEYSRLYVCGSHIGCCFRAKFGKVRGEDDIVLKGSLTKPYHSGMPAPPTAKGRAYKKRMKGRIDASVDEVAAVIDGKPKPKDVVKASAHLKGLTATYHQAYRAIERTSLQNWEQDKSSFQLVIPYLQKFQELNEESTVRFEKDGDHLSRIFVCPGIMKSTMRHVRPVMSLDAAHLKSQWKGTLYAASVKTACDEIYPVAIAIMNDNENNEGWSWFLRHLHSAIEILVMEHPQPRVAYKYFSFVSDRQKGLIEALQQVFPTNHSWFCAIHIQRNVDHFAGKKVAAYVHPLSVTCSHRLSTQWLEAIDKLSPRARTYLEEIPAKQWRGTAWLDDISLPPRYGIVTSNMSESTNNMFEKARDGSWLHSIDVILGTMTERIAALRQKVTEKEGIVPNILKQVRDNWEKCAGFKVIEVHNNGDEFNIVRPAISASVGARRYSLDIALCTCTCGKWQEYGYPCVDAMAYFRLHTKMSFTRILDELVDKQHKYETERELLEKNVSPVCMDTIAPDGCTLPPIPLTKRTSGRPKKQRFRKRSRWSHEPEKSTVRCSECGMSGHNKKTCAARKRQAEEDKKKAPDDRMRELDLS